VVETDEVKGDEMLPSVVTVSNVLVAKETVLTVPRAASSAIRPVRLARNGARSVGTATLAGRGRSLVEKPRPVPCGAGKS
jgi:hypothetical protein